MPIPPQVLIALAASLGGMFFKDNSTERLLRMLQERTSPGALTKETQQLYQMMLNSPAFSASMRNMLGGVSSARTGMASALANRGLTSTGIGSITQGAGSSLAGFGMSNLYSDYYKQAMQKATELMQMRIPGSLAAPRNTGAEMYGAFVNALPMLTKNMGAKPAAGAGTAANSYTGGSMGLSDMLNIPTELLGRRY